MVNKDFHYLAGILQFMPTTYNKLTLNCVLTAKLDFNKNSCIGTNKSLFSPINQFAITLPSFCIKLTLFFLNSEI